MVNVYITMENHNFLRGESTIKLPFSKCYVSFPEGTSWGFPQIGVPENGWFAMENATKMDDDWGYP